MNLYPKKTQASILQRYVVTALQATIFKLEQNEKLHEDGKTSKFISR